MSYRATCEMNDYSASFVGLTIRLHGYMILLHFADRSDHLCFCCYFRATHIPHQQIGVCLEILSSTSTGYDYTLRTY